MLEQTKIIVTETLNTHENPASLSGHPFEELVFKLATQTAVGTSFDGKLVHAENGIFPDIIAAKLFGIEVKGTKKDAWLSLGNSILESTRAKDVKKIYMFFGKLGGVPEIMYRNYEECLVEVRVTHNPRYLINMKLALGKSIFDKMEVSYEEISSSIKPVAYIRSYYKKRLKPGQELWWIDDDIDENTVSPIIKGFSSLEPEEQKKLKAEAFVLFPEILSSSTTKFEGVASFWAAKHGVVSYNLRDKFTASGQRDISVDGQKIRVPRIVFEMVDLTPFINKYFKDHPEIMIDEWKKRLDLVSYKMDLGIKLSKIFESNYK